jgi:multiple sugar transport system substrate-binding protein
MKTIRRRLSRRQLIKATVASAALYPALGILRSARAASEINWLMHPVHYRQMGNGALLKTLARETGIKVNITQMPFPEYREKLLLLLRENSSDFDIVGIANSWWDGSLNAYLLPLNDYMAKKPIKDAHDIIADYLFTVGSDTFAIPWRIGPMVMHYRKDLYKKYGLAVPKTFAEYQRNAQVITKGEKGAVAGAFFMGEQSFFSLSDWTSYLFSFNGAFLDSADLKKAKPAVNSKEGIAAMKYVAELSKERLMEPGLLTATWSTFITLMQQGKIAQAIEWSVYMKAVTDPKKSLVADKIAWAECPFAAGSGLAHSVTGTVGWGMFIPKASKRKDAAWEAIRWTARPESDLYMAVHGGGPFRGSTIRSPQYAKVTPATDVILKAISHGAAVWKPVGTLPNASEVIDKSVVDLQGALSGKLTADAACNNIAAHIEALALS